MADETATPKGGPLFWKSRKRPLTTDKSTQDERIKQLRWDMLFSGAKSSKLWEDAWPEMTEAEFDQALKAVSELSLGGHFPDGSHPDSTSKAQE